ncbi:hypothetical protein B0T16DRAFT_153467 [Cercophora newfieldiana]|uniref:Spp2/MOS2 G-patch domain-containing protein n=1 Tax=Cercophora newfieldiana TaxID=92897 RepID=A0AA40CPD1_9PEZI|nr:hypothetical protein B0T16DRAFT_153467 [Cercophora newfieldiana]
MLDRAETSCAPLPARECSEWPAALRPDKSRDGYSQDGDECEKYRRDHLVRWKEMSSRIVGVGWKLKDGRGRQRFVWCQVKKSKAKSKAPVEQARARLHHKSSYSTPNPPNTMPDDRPPIPLGASASTSNTPSIPLKKRSRPAHTKRHRAHTFQDDSSSSSDSEAEQSTRHKIITTYSSGPSDDERSSNRKTHRQRRPNPRSPPPREGQKNPQNGSKDGAADAPSKSKPVKWGLTINMKGKQKDQDPKARADARESTSGSSGNGKRQRDLDDEALEALVGTEPPKRIRYNSGDPDREPQAEDYKAIPIDDFGATLLRGFGWDGKMRGKVKEVTKHANLTGLGAKDAKEAEDLGAWNQKTSKDSRPVRLEDYNREQSKRREQLEDRHRDSYKRERERERDREREHRRR